MLRIIHIYKKKNKIKQNKIFAVLSYCLKKSRASNIEVLLVKYKYCLHLAKKSHVSVGGIFQCSNLKKFSLIHTHTHKIDIEYISIEVSMEIGSNPGRKVEKGKMMVINHYIICIHKLTAYFSLQSTVSYQY